MFWKTFVPPEILFSFGSVKIHAYGVCFSLALLCGLFCFFYCAKKYQKFPAYPHEKYFDFFIIVLFIGGIIGARLLYILYHGDYFFRFPLESIAVWHGGWVWHGGFIVGMIVLWFFSKKYRFSFLLFADSLVPGIALAQGVGRLGNYFNQEAYGMPTNFFLGIFIEPIKRLPGFEEFSFFHPTFLYESSIDIALFCILFFLTVRRFKHNEKNIKAGWLCAMYILMYSLFRFFIEYLRIDSVPILFGLRAPQWISLVFILGVLGIYMYLFRSTSRNKIISFMLCLVLFFSISPVFAEDQKTQILLDVPFTSQAPGGIWKDRIYQNACEETSLIMAMKWIQNKKMNLYTIRNEIKTLTKFEYKKYGAFDDRSATDTLQLVKDYFHYSKGSVRYDIHSDDIISELEKGNLVIVPVNGQKLKNSHFRRPGPLEHMLVVRGYDYERSEFITNDPGTQYGEKYRYKKDIFENSLRDYPTGNHVPIEDERTAMIVIKQKN